MTDILLAATVLCLALQVYHYLGYPMLLWGLVKVRPRRVRVGFATPKVSLIISAFNEAETIAAKLENSLALDWPHLEIIVVSDGSDDDTPRLVEGWADRGVIGLFEPQRRGKAAAMNRGAAAATGDILVFSDANAFYERDALTMLVANFADPTVGCASGRKSVRAKGADGSPSPIGQSDGLYWRYESMIRRCESRVGSTVSVVGEMMALRRQLYTPLPQTIINDDAYLALSVLRRGLRVVYEPQAICWEYPSSSMADEMQRRRRMIAGRCQLLLRPANWPWRQPLAVLAIASHKLMRLVLPFLMVGGIAGSVGLTLIQPMERAAPVLLLPQLAFYALALAGRQLQRAGRKWRLANLAYYITVSNYGVLRGILAFATGRQGVLWAKAKRAPVLSLSDQP